MTWGYISMICVTATIIAICYANEYSNRRLYHETVHGLQVPSIST